MLFRSDIQAMFHTVYVVLRDTGRRPREVCALPLECLEIEGGAFTGMGHLMWLDDNQNLVLRPAGDDSADLLNLPGPPQYGTFDPDAEWQLRAVEHALPNAAAGPTAFTGLAAAFTAQEVEALIITAADVAVGGAVEGLSSRQLQLAHRAYALLLADADEEAGRS